MEINPAQLRGLPSMEEANRHITEINNFARTDAERMKTAGQQLSTLADAVHGFSWSVPSHHFSEKYYTAQDHIDKAVNAHRNGDYDGAIAAAQSAHKAITDGYAEIYRKNLKTTPETRQLIDTLHSHFNNYYSTMSPAKIAEQPLRKFNRITVSVAPDLVDAANPTKAKRRTINAVHYQKRKGAK